VLGKIITIGVLLGFALPSTLLAESLPKAASKWVKIQSNPAATTYLNASSIRVRGKYKDVWEKVVWNTTDPKRSAASITLVRIDCGGRRNTILFSGAYLKNGDLVDAAGIPESQREWDEIAPKSPADEAMKFVCVK